MTTRDDGGPNVERVYKTLDRSKWPSGPWDSEPDKVQWKDTATGLPCLAVRHSDAGHWCGYVGVPEGHPWFEKDGYSAVHADVHGGLTFSGHCRPGSEDRAICHIPEPGESDNVWWLGFDCAHAWDWSPEDEKFAAQGGIWTKDWDRVYRSLAYVQSQCASLAQQAHEARP
jgi:hypothetical protein